MGVITDLIRTGQAKKQRDQDNQLRAFELAAKSDDPQLSQWGISSLTDLGQKHAPNPEVKKHIPILGQLAGMMKQMNPVPKAPEPSQGPAPKYDPQRAAQEKMRQATLQAERDSLINKQAEKDHETATQMQIQNQSDTLKGALDRHEIDEDQYRDGIAKAYGVGTSTTLVKPADALHFKGADGKITILYPRAGGGLQDARGKRTEPPAGAELIDKPSASSAKAVPGVIAGSDPALQAWASESGTSVDPKKSYHVTKDGNSIVSAFEAYQKPEESMTGTLKQLYQSFLAMGHTAEVAKQRAAKQYVQNYAAGAATKELNLAVERELAGISGVSGGTGGGTTPEPKGTGSPTPPKGAVPAKGQPVASEVDAQAVDEFIGRAIGLLQSGRDKYSNLRARRGLSILEKQTGMTETQIYASVQAKKDTAKALGTSVQKLSGIEQLTNTIDQHGKLLEEAKGRVDSTGIPVLNRWINAGKRAVSGDPEIGALDIAVNAVAREYARLVSGGFASNAMPHVSSQEQAKEAIAASMTDGTIAKVVDQLKKEAAAEKKALVDQQKGLFDEISSPVGGGRLDQNRSPAAAPYGGGRGAAGAPAAAAPKSGKDYAQRILGAGGGQ